MADRPALVLDVNGTLSDTGTLGGRFAEQGADPLLARLWFASVLRDGIAVTAVGGNADFSELAADLLPPLLDGQPLRGPLPEVVRALTGALAALPPRPDVGPGLQALQEAGFRIAALTNGSVANAERVLVAAGVRQRVEAVLSVQDLGAWKPASAAYLAAARALGVEPTAAMLVAAHPWDLQGAAAAGMRTAWLRRDDPSYPSAMPAPEVVIDDLRDLAGALGAG